MPTDSFLQRAEAWEKQKRLRAFAAQQREPPADENQQPSGAKQRDVSVSKQKSAGRVRQQPRQTLRF